MPSTGNPRLPAALLVLPALLLTALPAVVAAPRQKEKPKSLLRQLVPRTTGRNGYEEFLMAADLVKSSKLWQEVGRKQLTLAQKRRVLGDRKLQRALALVRKGVSKRVHSPRESLDFESPLPELGALRRVAGVQALQQYVYYADGRNREALDVLRVGLRFGNLIQQDSLISGLVGLAVSIVNIRATGDHLDQLSARDCEYLHRLCLEWLQMEDPLPRVIEAERAGIKRSMRTIFLAKPEALRGILEDAGDGDAEKSDRKPGQQPGTAPGHIDPDRAAAQFRQAQGSPEQARALLAQVDGRVDEAFRLLYVEYRKPPWQRQDIELPADGSVGGFIIALVMPSMSRSFDAYSRGEAMIRLLATHAVIRRYEWEHAALPASLKTLDVAALAIDPFTGQPLKYRRLDAAYELTSAGPVADPNDQQAVDGRRPVSVTR